MALFLDGAPAGFEDFLKLKYQIQQQELASQNALRAAQTEGQQIQNQIAPDLAGANINKMYAGAEADRARAGLLSENTLTSREARATGPAYQQSVLALLQRRFGASGSRVGGAPNPGTRRPVRRQSALTRQALNPNLGSSPGVSTTRTGSNSYIMNFTGDEGRKRLMQLYGR